MATNCGIALENLMRKMKLQRAIRDGNPSPIAIAEAMAKLAEMRPALQEDGPWSIVRPSDPMSDRMLSEVSLKYPDNVVVVPSPDGTSRPPAPGTITHPTITEAVEYAVDSANRGKAKQFSILVHAGIFGNDLQVCLRTQIVP